MAEINDFLRIYKDKTHKQQQDEVLLKPYAHICQNPGKEFRSKFCYALNHWHKIPMDKLLLIVDVVGMLHNASLLLDDIEGNAVLRRGIPVAHSIYGTPNTINAAVYVTFLALNKTMSLSHSEAVKIFLDQILELHRGQILEIYWRESLTIPSESEYKVMALQKTGGLFMLSLRLMQLFSTSKRDFTKLTAILGLYFQILNDYRNLCVKEGADNKTFCVDLTDGKFSFPIIHAIQNEKDNKQVFIILKQQTKDMEVKKYCISLLRQLGSLKYTRDALHSLDKQAREEVDRLGNNPLMESMLNELLSSWKTVED